jgi:hypothetical protein
MRLLAAHLILLALLASANAAEPKITVVVEGLNNPTAVAQQPGGDLFVAESGAGRVVRIVEGKAFEAIGGSAIDKYGKGPIYDIGPLGLAFLNDKQVVVSDGGYADGEEFVRIFEVPGRGADPVKFDAPLAKLGPLAAVGDAKAEGNLYGVAVAGQAIFVTCNGDDAKGWIARTATTTGGPKSYGPLERFIASKEATGVDAPAGITVEKSGLLVVGQMGKIDAPKDSRLAFYHPKTGKLLLNLETGLYDIAGLGYSPTGLLYVVDFAWMSPGEGGLYRLDAVKSDAGQAIKATKIAALDKPTAICFGTDGSLYATVLGTAKAGDAAKPGKLLKIELDEK